MIDNHKTDLNNSLLRVKFNNMYEFPYKSMYIPNKFPVRVAADEQPSARQPLRRARKPARRQNVPQNVQPNVHQPVQQNVPEVVQPPIQSARSVRAAKRRILKK